MVDGKMNKIIYEDNHLLVVEKPQNVLVQADNTNDLDLLTILKKYIKEKYNMNKLCEVKWTKVSPDKIQMYRELVEYFFNNEHLFFRAVVVDKTKLKEK